MELAYGVELDIYQSRTQKNRHTMRWAKLVHKLKGYSQKGLAKFCLTAPLMLNTMFTIKSDYNFILYNNKVFTKFTKCFS